MLTPKMTLITTQLPKLSQNKPIGHLKEPFQVNSSCDPENRKVNLAVGHDNYGLKFGARHGPVAGPTPLISLASGGARGSPRVWPAHVYEPRPGCWRESVSHPNETRFHIYKKISQFLMKIGRGNLQSMKSCTQFKIMYKSSTLIICLYNQT